MQQACRAFLGAHDFRNFCRIDDNKARLETSYTREIFKMEIAAIGDQDDGEDSPYRMFALEIRGSGFLWHMIRCIVSVLFDIGFGKESASVSGRRVGNPV